MAHTNEATGTEANSDQRLDRIEAQLDTLGTHVEALQHDLSELHNDFKTERLQTNITLQYLLASLMDLQNRPHAQMQFRWWWEKR